MAFKKQQINMYKMGWAIIFLILFVYLLIVDFNTESTSNGQIIFNAMLNVMLLGVSAFAFVDFLGGAFDKSYR